MDDSPRLRKAPRSRRALAGVALGVLAALLALAFAQLPLGRDMELSLLDQRTRWMAEPGKVDPRIVLVQVQDSDVAWLRDQFSIPWPWDLEVNAQLFDLMAEAGVATVLVDVLHLDRGSGPEDVPEGSDMSEAAVARRELEQMGAQAYGAALARLNSAVAFALSDQATFDLPKRRAATEASSALPPLPDLRVALARKAADLPVLDVAAGARRLGFVNVEPDSDGVLRRVSVLGLREQTAFASLAARGAELASGAPVQFGPRYVQVGTKRQALMEGASFLVNFRKPGRNAYPSLAPATLMKWVIDRQQQGALPEEARAALSGKIVVWGVNLRGNEDVVPTPVSETLDGPEFQATALDNLLQGDGRVTVEPWVNPALLFALLALVGFIGFGARRRAWMHALPVLALGALSAASLWLFDLGLVIDVALPVVGLAGLWGLMAGAHLMTEGRRNRWLEGTFGRYLSPAIIQRLKEDPSLLELGGREREVSILFSDIEGFTSQSEKLTPAQLVSLLNEYLTQHADAVLAQGGVVDKFIGDAVMAFYGDPVPTADHALAACRTALDVRDRLPALGELWQKMGLTSLRVRFGINTGRVVVGNMGSHQRFSYTAMGDTVNFASRLESANRFFGSTILLGEQTAHAVKDAILTRPIARLRVKGKAEPVGVHEALAEREKATSEQLSLVQHYTMAHQALQRGDLDGAGAAIDAALQLRPQDGPTHWLARLREQLAAGAVPTPWDGVFVLAEK